MIEEDIDDDDVESEKELNNSTHTPFVNSTTENHGLVSLKDLNKPQVRFLLNTYLLLFIY
jgi:hypothetical protein